MNGIQPPSISSARVYRVENGLRRTLQDALAVEEPLEIRISYGTKESRATKSISITMRTPGHDAELAAGFLFTEGIVQSRDQIESVEPCGPSGNVVKVELRRDLEIDLKRIERHFYTSSSCGVCGKSSIDALRVKSQYPLVESSIQLAAEQVHALPERLREQQKIFECTGGLHASALFSAEGQLVAMREDVGRHNALDKIIGAAFLAGRLPLWENILLVSGRASFELVQKAASAGIALFAAVGAPSSLAVELARECEMTLLGFVRKQKFNIYCGEERIIS